MFLISMSISISMIERVELMEKYKIIFLNGVTSSGKTSIAKAIQEMSDTNFYHVSNDHFHSLLWDFLDKPAQDVWKENFIHSVHTAESIALMYHSINFLSESTNIIVDGMLFETEAFTSKYGKTNYDCMREILHGQNMLVVEVYCPLDECRRRNIARGNRGENQSHEQDAIMNKAVRHDIKVDTSVFSAEKCARQILDVF